MRNLTRFCLAACLWLFSCSHSANPWIFEGIAAGNLAFDSARLRYQSSQAHPPLLFEMLKVGDHIEAFLSLNRFRFNVPSDQIKVFFTIEAEQFVDEVPIREGRMRIRLSPETTQRLILALQEGKKIGILVDGFEETLDPMQFSSSFAKFEGKGQFFQNLLKGPF